MDDAEITSEELDEGAAFGLYVINLTQNTKYETFDEIPFGTLRDAYVAVVTDNLRLMRSAEGGTPPKHKPPSPTPR